MSAAGALSAIGQPKVTEEFAPSGTVAGCGMPRFALSPAGIFVATGPCPGQATAIDWNATVDAYITN